MALRMCVTALIAAEHNRCPAAQQASQRRSPSRFRQGSETGWGPGGDRALPCPPGPAGSAVEEVAEDVVVAGGGVVAAEARTPVRGRRGPRSEVQAAARSL